MFCGGKKKGTKFKDFLAKQLKNPEFRKEYEVLQSEYVVQAMIDARRASGLTQKELSERTGITQGDICKLERGNANPSLKTLQRLALGMGMVLKVEFIPLAQREVGKFNEKYHIPKDIDECNGEILVLMESGV